MKRSMTVLAAAAVMSALAPVTSASAETEDRRAWLESGEAPAGATLDVFNDVSTDGGATWADATIVAAPAGAAVLPESRWISAGAGDAAGPGTTLFRRGWHLPSGLLTSSARVCVHAVESVVVRLNGSVIIDQPDGGAANAQDPADCVTVVDQLEPGGNLFEFTVGSAGAARALDFTVAADYTIDLDAPPLLVLPEDMTVEATSPQGARVVYQASGRDAAGYSLIPTCTHPSGSTFAAGTTTVTCEVTGTRGGSTTGSFAVTVNPWPDEPPVLHLPDDFSRDATSAEGAEITFGFSALDPDGGASPVVTCDPAPGSVLAVGSHTVTCAAVDDEGTETRGSFTVTVNPWVPPDVAPELQLPADRTVNTKSLIGARVRWTATATDDSGTPVVTCTPVSGAFFRIGSTEVSCTAEDAGGRRDSGSFTVTVRGPVQRACDHLDSVGPTWSTHWLQWRLRSAGAEVADARRPADARALRQLADRVRAAGGEYVRPDLHRAAVALADRVEDRLGC